jgi:hypothetical protein
MTNDKDSEAARQSKALTVTVVSAADAIIEKYKEEQM